MMISGIYEIKNRATGDFYIGSSNDIRKRISHHRGMLKRNVHHSIYLQRAWNKYGEDNFEFRTVCLCQVDKLLIYEQILLDNLSPSYNMGKNAVAAAKGRTWTDERKKKFIKTRTGKKLSEETKVKIGLANKGHSNSLLGRPRPQETRNKISTARKGKCKGSSFAAKIYKGFISPDGIVYKEIKNLAEFCRNNNLSNKMMSRLSLGKRTHHKGWTSL